MTALNTFATEEELARGLNNEQIEAVKHSKGPLLIIAGAGTGKTTVITRKIAYLISSKLAKPSEILALTFTDKAANEMEERVDKLVPYGYVDVQISTFHAFGDRILRDYAINLKLRPDYRVLSYEEQMVLFREHWHEFPLNHYSSLSDPVRHIEALMGVISRAQDEDISSEEYLQWAEINLKRQETTDNGLQTRLPEAEGDLKEAEKQLEVALVYKKYQEIKAKKGFIDFGDQVCLVLKLFREHPVIRKKFQKEFKYILVDEFQDTNYSQFELLKLLACKNQNITVVGDDDQSIYKFRGAAVSNILNFTKTYKKARQIVLKRNYRSTQLILDSSYRLIQHNNPERLEVKNKVDKKLIAENDKCVYKPEYKSFDKISSEADFVAKTIKEKWEGGAYRLKDFAVLIRSRANAEPFLGALNLLNVPYVFSGGGGLYVFPEIKLVISFLRVIGDLADSVSLYELSISSIYKLDAHDMQKINTFARRRNFTLHYVYSHMDETQVEGSSFFVLNDLKSESIDTIKKIMVDVEFYLDFAKTHTTGEVLYKFLKRSGYLKELTAYESLESENKVKNLATFFDKVRAFKEIAEIDRVSEFVRYLNVLKEAGENPEVATVDTEVDAVNILTVHRSKGLEFPVVFLVSLVVDRFPVRDRKDPIELPCELIKENVPSKEAHVQEERRLFYVAMTRAKTELFLTSSLDCGGKRERKVSPFVLEALDLPKADLKTFKKSAIEQIELFAPQEIKCPPFKQIKPDEILHLSFYLIDDYLTCPLKYKYVHILNVPLLPSHTIMYGSALHKAVQSYFSARIKNIKFVEKDLIDAFKNNWSSEGFISREHEERRFEVGIKSLKKFYKEAEKSTLTPKFVEKEFKFKRGNVQIAGRFDLVLTDNRQQTTDDRLIIVDFKSTEVKDQESADKKAKNSMQLAIYSMAWQEMFGKIPDLLQLHFLDSGHVGSTKKELKELDKIWDKIKKVEDGIRSSSFHATPGAIQCGYCPYSEICNFACR
ncbi:hypothetical protein A2230_02655 [candidate division WOR-1 bacterium RIFOXYA2_FULL_36_21]|uniref:DNA 3'-5' helicase n=1 Tax=candidate division WOR-1 bacterium RIFOXYB2_FULL_36_35 TaxID=1802578 RepID=A0A1F4RXE5_UNCSA|nr:MAG: hypothetical protein A2230_02655 [candidate division WOR-1 bacterium RIFOXYA2_FULL_36_21]OGC12856.1 MAG: hypothetical protein A2290_02705 [candidate division WOR-1 bacterium RIFOXYB2_FULL_36_35]OGC19928.1 MAG: hypothetical protein A2282_02655 [candidate division WOR-1 bacterium RIFOXYA12_FULL_36_13]